MTGVGRISYVSNYLLKVIIMNNELKSRSLFRQSVRLLDVATLIVLTLYGIKMNDSLTSSVVEESRDDIDGTKFIQMIKIQT